MRTNSFAGLILSLCVLAESGCSVVMAGRQPGKKDTSVFAIGTPRDRVIAEVGPPSFTEAVPDGRKDIFNFVQGYSTGAKVARGLFHGAADFFTAGLWEVVGTPTEQALNGTEVSVAVVYDPTDHIRRVDVLKGDKVVQSSASVAAPAGAPVPAAETAAPVAEPAVPAPEFEAARAEAPTPSAPANEIGMDAEPQDPAASTAPAEPAQGSMSEAEAEPAL